MILLIYTHQNVHYFQEWAARCAKGCSFEPQLDVKLGRISAAPTWYLLETGKLHHKMDNAWTSVAVPLDLQQHQCKLLSIELLHLNVAYMFFLLFTYYTGRDALYVAFSNVKLFHFKGQMSKACSNMKLNRGWLRRGPGLVLNILSVIKMKYDYLCTRQHGRGPWLHFWPFLKQREWQPCCCLRGEPVRTLSLSKWEVTIKQRTPKMGTFADQVMQFTKWPRLHEGVSQQRVCGGIGNNTREKKMLMRNDAEEKEALDFWYFHSVCWLKC